MHEYRKLSTELAGCCLNRPEPGPEIASNTVEGGLLGAGRRPHRVALWAAHRVQWRHLSGR